METSENTETSATRLGPPRASTSRRIRAGAFALVLVTPFLLASRGHADPVKCQRTIVKEGAKLAQTRLGALAKCEAAKRRGKLPTSTDCATEPKNADRLAQAEAKLGDAIAKACGGHDKACNAGDTGADADEALAAIGWGIGQCPGFERSGCTNPIDDCAGIGTCVACVTAAAVDQMVALTRDDLAPATPGDPVATCQAAIGTATARFLAAESKLLQHCEDVVLDGKIAGPCPDAATRLAIVKAEVKKVAAICKACGGGDRACGGGDDLAVDVIGFPATCPALTIPDGGSCGGPVTTLEDLVACVDCVATFKGACLDAVGVPGLKSYPGACGPQPTPTPTATATPTLTPTPTFTPPPGPDAVRCQRTLVKQLAKLGQTELAAVVGCEQSKRAGKLGPATDCRQEPRTAAKIEKARAKFRAAVPKSCGGGNRVCSPLDGGGDTDAGLGEIGWGGGHCPNFENGSCDQLLVDCNDVAACAECVSAATVTQAAALYYGNLAPAPAGSALSRCQAAIGEETARFFAAKSKALQKCGDAILTGKIPGPCPEPGDGKAAVAIAKAELEKIDAICRACGGDDAACGGGDDLTPTAIGFVATCPAVTVPGGAACGGAVTTLEDLIACVDCVTEFKADCLARIAVPDVLDYPGECNPSQGPTPTATSTPAPTGATPTGGTPTPSTTATPSGPRCGDGIRQRNLGEDCDDGNNLDCDECPADCRTDVANCSVTGTYVQPIEIAAPIGTPLGGASICISYPDGTVGLPQNANGQVPTNRIGYTGGFFTAVDFENAVQISLTQSPADDRIDLTLTFDHCGTAPIPPPAAYRCRTVTASDDLGTPIDPVRIVCTVTTP